MLTRVFSNLPSGELGSASKLITEMVGKFYSPGEDVLVLAVKLQREARSAVLPAYSLPLHVACGANPKGGAQLRSVLGSLKSSSCASDMASSLKYTLSVASFKDQCYQTMRLEISQEDPKWCLGFYFPSLLKLECSKFKLRKCLLLIWFIRDAPP